MKFTKIFSQTVDRVLMDPSGSLIFIIKTHVMIKVQLDDCRESKDELELIIQDLLAQTVKKIKEPIITSAQFILLHLIAGVLASIIATMIEEYDRAER